MGNKVKETAGALGHAGKLIPVFTSISISRIALLGSGSRKTRKEHSFKTTWMIKKKEH